MKFRLLAVLLAALFILASCGSKGKVTPVPSENTAEDEFQLTDGKIQDNVPETKPDENSEREPETEREEPEKEPASSDAVTEIKVANGYTFNSPFPVMYIDTKAGVNSKDVYVNASMKLYQGDKLLYGENTSDIQIKLRGNSSLYFEKKPYKIKLAEKTSFFGFSESRHWLLMACSFDRSLIRDKLALDLSSLYFDYYTKSDWVEVIMNGKYIGTFQLCEQIRVEKDRVNIKNIEDKLEKDEISIQDYTDENGYDITGGYLLEMSVQFDEKSKFHTAVYELPIMIKSPEDAADNPKMMTYLKKYFQDFELAIKADDLTSIRGLRYTDLFDFDDLVDYWVLSSFYKTHDFMINSTFMYKDAADKDGVEDKIHMGPMWDIGNSLGNYTSLNGWLEPTEAESWSSKSDGNNNWYKQICKDPYFMVKAQESFCRLIEPVNDIIKEGGLLDTYKNQLSDSVEANQYLYPTFDKSEAGWPENECFDDEVEWIRDFMKKRLDFMSRELADLDNISLKYCKYKDYLHFVDIILKNADGSELLRGEHKNELGVAADYKTDYTGSVMIEASCKAGNSVYARIYVNDSRSDKYELKNGSFTAAVDCSEMEASDTCRDVITVRFFDKNDKMTGINYVTVAKQ